MRILDIVRLRLRSLFHAGRIEQELDEELRYHLEREAEESGITLTAGVEQRKEECRDARGLSLLDATVQDVRYGLRQLRRSPAFAFTALFVLMLGIAAAVTVLAFVDAALIRPLPYRDQSRLIGVYESSPAYPRSIISYFDFKDWQRMNSVFRSLDAYALNGNFTLTTGTGLEQVPGTRVSSGFFRTLGVRPMFGRDFLPSEDSDSAAQTVVISYPAWQKRFGGRRDVLGQVLTLNGSPTTIVGILPPDFQFALYPGEFYGSLRSSGGCEQQRGCRNLLPVGRLKDGVSLDRAAAQMRAIAMQLKRQFPADNSDIDSVRLIPLRELIIGDVRPILLVLLAGAALLLLIACVNVSTLLLARSNQRGREFAMRRALGASRVRLFRQFLVEGVLLAAGSCGLGILAARWGIRALVALVPPEQAVNLPFLQRLTITPLTVAAALSAATLAAALFALIPITTNLSWEMGSRGSTGTSWRRLGSRLVVLELAVTIVLMAGAALLGQSSYQLLHLDLGFNPDHLALAGTMWRPEDYTSEAKQAALFREFERQIAAVRGVQAVALCGPPPVDSDWFTGSIHIVGRPNHGETNEVYQRPVSAGFFAAIQAHIQRGRIFRDDEDGSKPPVAIVNQALVRRYFGGARAVGQSIYYDWDPKHPMEIVGVVADIKEGPLQGTNAPAVYRPIYQQPTSWPTILVRTREPESRVLPRVAAAIQRIDPFIAVSGESMAERIGRSPAACLHRSAAYVVGGFAAVALLLSVVGLYGVVAYSVSQRTREIGLRMALGAGQSTVHRLILSEAARLTALGVAFGIAGSLAGARLLGSLLFGVSAWDLPTRIGVAALLGFSALLASYIPAHRAASVNPVEALRAD